MIMVTRLVMIEGIDHTVIAPIVNSVVKDIEHKFLKDDDIKVYMGTYYEEDNSEVNDRVTTNKIGKSKLFVNFEYEDDEELSYNPSIFKSRDKNILLDKQTGFRLKPISTATKLNISFTYKNKSRVAVNKIINKLKNFYKFTGYTLSHRLNYSYLLPDVLMSLMSDIAILKDEPDVFNFIEQASLVKFDYAVKRGSDFKVPSFRGVEAGIIGNIEEDAKSFKITKEEQMYMVDFTYTLVFDKPNALAVTYPITINNKPLNSKWLPKEEVAVSRDLSNGTLDINRILGDKFNLGLITSDILIRVPNFDQFTPDNGADKDRIKLLSVLIQIDANEPDVLLDIHDLKYLGIPDYIIEYFLDIDEYDLFQFGASLFQLELFENNYIKDKGLVKTSDGKIVATKPLDTTKTYHLLFNVITNKNLLKYINPKGNDRLNRDIELMNKMGIMFRDDTFVLMQKGNNTNGM